MTKEEINSATPEWLNEQTLKALEIEIVETESKESRIKLGEAVVSGKRMAFRAVVTNHICITDGGRWNPAEDIRDAADLQTKIKEIGLIDKYSKCLTALIDPGCDLCGNTIYSGMDARTMIFKIAHATPEQRTKAFLLAMMEEKEPPKSDWEELADICSESARKAGLAQERSRELLQEAREILKPGN